MKAKNIFLFSIDLEDARVGVVNGHQYKDRVVANTKIYLDWLKKTGFNCTFFTVGEVAEKYPDLIRKIIDEGHELACHTWNHVPLNKQNPESFKKDLEKNIEALYKCGASSVTGFRAPVFSLTKETQWAYDVMAACGITYSSSVLPAQNPLYGWQEFGQSKKQVNNSIVEIPMSLNKFGPLTIPFAGGVYFRCLPFFFIRQSFQKRFASSEPVLSYFHPYDLDTEQEHYMHAGINNSRFYNFLMYYNRKNLINRLDALLKMDVKIMTYQDYLKTI
ncbi:MAG: polysaccharide deacetylase, carbohydrate Esterase Family 4-like protein [Bacteroidetes bacterium]|nr:polysaccharide deacetylase, carbohydrate Esterase Family 4-like protein [Bacteroidota bacterium]